MGTPVIYASSSTALAVCELIVHKGLVPYDHVVVQFDLPESLLVEDVDAHTVSSAWPYDSSISATKDFGTEWVKSLRTPVLKVPSAVIRPEHNYLLNPSHPDYPQITYKILENTLDARLHNLAKLIRP